MKLEIKYVDGRGLREFFLAGMLRFATGACVWRAWRAYEYVLL